MGLLASKYLEYEMYQTNIYLCRFTTGINWIIGFLRSINSWNSSPLKSIFFSSICKMQNNWSIVDLSYQNPKYCSLVITSTCGIMTEKLKIKYRVWWQRCFLIFAIMSGYYRKIIQEPTANRSAIQSRRDAHYPHWLALHPFRLMLQLTGQ
jgi:hypothetical protein